MSDERTLKPIRECSVPDCHAIHYCLGYCRKHHARFRRSGNANMYHGFVSDAERFWAKVDKTETCWLWTAAKNGIGYGLFGYRTKLRLAHRVAFEWENGLVPRGLELDHLCRTRNCVRPSHLEAVTHTENMRRGNKRQRNLIRACRHGHEFTESNSGINSVGYRFCRKCRLEASRRRNQKIKQKREMLRGGDAGDANA